MTKRTFLDGALALTEAFRLNHAKAIDRAAELNALLERTGSIDE